MIRELQPRLASRSDTINPMRRIEILIALLSTAFVITLWTPISSWHSPILLLLALALALIERRARIKEAAHHQLTAKVFDTSGNGMLISDKNNIIVAINPAFSAITGYAPEEIVGKTPKILSSGRHDKAFYHALWQALETQGMWQGEIWDRRKNGEVYAEWLTINTVKNPRGEVTHYIAIFSDITERKAQAERVEYMATHDTLTGLPNRALFSELLNKSLADARRANEHVAVLFLDLDRFKIVNDTLGHGVGDLLLDTVADRLRAATRAGDIVARQGGDEFIIALPRLATQQDAALIADKIGNALNHPCILAGHELHISTSIGIALFPEDGADATTLLKNADAALYRAKAMGRNNFQFFTADMNSNTAERLALENALRRALERQELSLHYQPQVDLPSGRIVGAEALLRWQHPEWGIVSPARFMPIAEESGLINAIGAWVLTEACREAQSWSAPNDYSSVAVNLSAVQLRQLDLVNLVEAALTETGLAPARLELELTENTIMRDTAATRSAFEALHALGVKFAIDDFGTGYSSLTYLRQLPIDKLKIDRSFVADIPQSADASAIAATIVRMGASLGLQTIAEGVETQEQYDWLAHAGCHQAQGYLIAKPMPAEAFRALLAKQSAPI